MQQPGIGAIMLSFGKIVPDFITHAVFARAPFMKDHPQELRDFLAGWFDAIAYMHAHKAETVSIAAKVMPRPADVVSTA